MAEEKCTNRCLECGVDMGHSNPRQFCGKTQCDNMAAENLKKFITMENNEEEEPYYYYAGEFISIHGIIKGGLQFDSLDDALQWRTRRLQEISNDPGIDTNFYEFPYLVIKSERTIVGTIGNIWRIPENIQFD